MPLVFACAASHTPGIRAWADAAPARCYALGQVLGSALANDASRVAVVASGGLSHAPGTRTHGEIDSDFDLEFLRRLTAGETEAKAILGLNP
jgi:hypothetical protein